MSYERSEVLFVASQSSDPFSVEAYDTQTGVAVWKYKGSELQGMVSGAAAPVGNDGQYFILASANRPFLHCVSFQQRERYHQKAGVEGAISCFVVSSDGCYLYAAIEKKIFCWTVADGNLVAFWEAHFQRVSALGLSSDNAFIFSGSEDGSVHGYLSSTMLASYEKKAPFRSWKAHSLKVNALHVSQVKSPRVLSVGADHCLMLHSLNSDACLLKVWPLYGLEQSPQVSAERPLTACFLDTLELAAFIGSDEGSILRIPFDTFVRSLESTVETSDARLINAYRGHESQICQLCVNGDGSLLASGDDTGQFRVWDTQSKQCLKIFTKTGPIVSLRFLPAWESFNELVVRPRLYRPKFNLKHTIADSRTTSNVVRPSSNYASIRAAQIDELYRLSDHSTRPELQLSAQEFDDLAAANAEIKRLRQSNAKLHEFCVQWILTKQSTSSS